MALETQSLVELYNNLQKTDKYLIEVQPIPVPNSKEITIRGMQYHSIEMFENVIRAASKILNLGLLDVTHNENFIQILTTDPASHYTLLALYVGEIKDFTPTARIDVPQGIESIDDYLKTNESILSGESYPPKL